ncbi:olfactory receptor 24-like [Tachyglossus aculeatus]|uniref:olfactory receptor 24-like n=1 Tax=Tachyglossus aculeatus TaxID=9261 RepID=UPI0018F7B60B|nr:olfactory receptor 24-like [Tachyglossus aculeatus]
MEPGNQTGVSGFVLLGLSREPGMQRLLFMVFLGLYLVTTLGNLLIVLAVGSDPRLHSPMYFFLANLSFADIGLTSATVPKMLADLRTQNPTISYAGCLAQLYFFMTFGALDDFLLATMAYDRFMAICHPLSYTTAMSPRHCGLLLAVCWGLTSLAALVHTLLLTRLSFCVKNSTIPHFFCDLAPLLPLSCSDPTLNRVMLLIVGTMVLVAPLGLILGSYARIVAAVLRVPSARGKHRAFSTCGSHLAVVSLFYGTAVAVYLCPPSSHSAGKDRIAAVLYTAVTPLLNPFIYSLRNRDLHRALRRSLWNRDLHETLQRALQQAP